MQTTRRDVLKAASSVFSLTFIPSYLATGARAEGDPEPPSKRINLGCVGVGGRAGAVVPSICKNGKATPVALCDVAFGASRGIEKNLKRYPDVQRFTDFRVMMEKAGKDIDAVSVVTPDHTHFPAAILAMSMGKHVYVEKPLTHSFQEAEMLMAAEKKFNVVTQMGNQGHTGFGPHQFQEWMKRGVIHNVTEIDAWKGPGLFFMDKTKRISDYPKGEPKPKGLDWDLWCGPLPRRSPSARCIIPSTGAASTSTVAACLAIGAATSSTTCTTTLSSAYQPTSKLCGWTTTTK